MITLNVTVPSAAAIIAASYTEVQLLKSSTQTAAGPYVAIAGTATVLVVNQTSYTLVDPLGGWGDWYQTNYTNGTLNSTSSPSQPGYLSDLCNTIRDLLGVTTNEVTDTQVQGFSYLPTALARIRQRFKMFDTTVAAATDAGALCLGALAHLVAALLCPRMTVAVVDSEQFDKYRYQRNRQMDWSQTQQELLTQYENLISMAAGELSSVTTLYIPGVVMAGPSRAGYDTSAGLITLEDEDSPYTTEVGGETEGQGDGD